MRALIQRVSEASVQVDGNMVGQIGRGALVLLGVEQGDDQAVAERLCDRVLTYRIFPDERGHMNLSLTDIGGELLVISQFTLVADTRKGRRPSFSSAAAPDVAERLYNEFVLVAGRGLGVVETGEFGADMKVQLENDGPVTFLLEVKPGLTGN